jgi:hypothetical protein
MRFTHLLLIPILLGACRPQEGLTREEARQALEEIQIASTSQSLTASTVEIATDFTIGQAVEQAAERIRATVASQLPCADIELTGNTLTVEYGALGPCPPYRGQVLTGTHAITVTANDEQQVLVEHRFIELANGVVSVTGEASATWDLAKPSRHVVHDLLWTRLRDGKTGEASGDRTQRPLAGGLAEGFRVEGSHVWQAASGRWDLDIDQVEMRWVDPVPQAGTYTLDTPFDKTVSATFERKNEDTITVTLSGRRGDLSFDVTRR